MKKVLFLIGTVVFFVFGSVGFSDAAEETPLSQSEIFIETETARVPFRVELAVTPEQHAQGLMFRRSLPENGGMLFLFPEEKIRYMWMKNTFIPLDMVFADKSGKIVFVVENAQPFDETIISSESPAAVVLEVSAGTVRRFGIRVGQLITGKAFFRK